jgi:cell division protein FtsN
MAPSKYRQRGNVVVGIIIGVVLGLAAALAVAVYVTKVPVPFLNKGTARTAEQDAAESRKNQNWDPNAPLYGKNPARPIAPAPGVGTQTGPGGVLPLPGPLTPAEKADAKDKDKPADKATAVASAPKKSADPLGELAAARSGGPMPTPPAVAGGDPFFYFVQAGAFRTAEDAEAQRAKLSLMGVEAKVTEREQSGRQVWRVRVGPFNSKEEADRNKEKLESGGVETALVRVQR